MELTAFRGTLSLCGVELIEHIQRLAPGAHVEAPHITIISKSEVQKHNINLQQQSLASILQTSLQILTVGNSKEVEFLTVSWPHGQIYRKKLGLEPKDFHITLSKVDRHDIPKDITTTKGGFPAFVKMFQQLPETAMDFILAGPQVTPWQQDLSLEFLAHFQTSYKALIRVADSSHDQPHLSTNAYARALTINPSLHDYITRQLSKLSGNAPCGPFRIETLEQLPSALVFPWPQEARDAVRGTMSDFPTESRIRVQYLNDDKPLARFFSMPIPYRLAGMSTPRHEQDIDTLSRIGITKILTLTEEEPLDPSWFKYKRIANQFIPVPNYKPPTIAEMDYIYKTFMEDVDGFWLIHCGGGKGRAGTVIACILAMHGSVDGTPQMEKNQVIDYIRKIRPGSIETSQQEDFVSSWLSHRWKIAHTSTMIDEPFTTLVTDINPKQFPAGLNAGNVKFIMLVGLPGSGKSYVAESIALRRTGQTIIISQDDSGSRSACESQIQGKYKDDTLLILDRCNPEALDRKYWLSLLMSTANTVCLFFDYDIDLCLQRIDGRLNHPTIQAGRGRNAVKQMREMMQRPTLAEGFGAVLKICSHNAGREAILKLGGVVGITKFPRTTHLINLGAMGSDDLVIDDWKDDLRGQIVLEEKIDGANMGFSLDFDKNLLIQNRSHYVNYSSHAQFRPLKIWLERNSDTLIKLLDLDSKFPERYILYGEWVAAKHSIAYTSLPDFFMAFDFFDRRTKTFVSREYLSRMLKGTGISQVPLIKSLEYLSRSELLAYMTRQSEFYEGPIEGVYVRFEDEDRTVTKDRGKVVRSDFIAGNEHWTKADTQLNELKILNH